MTRLAVAGGTYLERCQSPSSEVFLGSAGRAAAALAGEHEVELHTYTSAPAREMLETLCARYGLVLHGHLSDYPVVFDYEHSLLPPAIQPFPLATEPQEPFRVEAKHVLRFGMLESSAVVAAQVAVFDPQSELRPETFAANGSVADRLAVVLNRTEARALTGETEPEAAARTLMRGSGARAVFIKSGSEGVTVAAEAGTAHVPAYFVPNVFSIGSGDVFSAMVLRYWGVDGMPAAEAADLASRAVARYVSTRTLPLPPAAELLAEAAQPVRVVPGRVYLAGPFFTMSERRLVEEARRLLAAPGLEVFSPLHEVGLGGEPRQVAAADLRGLEGCDRVLAILDGGDPGTLFEVGYARARGIPVFCLAQAVPSGHLTMFEGSGCEIVGDFVSAIYRTQWKR